VRLPIARSAGKGLAGKSQSCVSVHSRHILTNRTVIRDSKGRGAECFPGRPASALGALERFECQHVGALMAADVRVSTRAR
jgi:hypothetical protein